MFIGVRAGAIAARVLAAPSVETKAASEVSLGPQGGRVVAF